MRRPRLLQPPDQADLVVHARPERIDEHRLQRGLFGNGANRLGDLAAINGTVVDDREQVVAPQPGKDRCRGVALVVAARPQPEDRPAGFFAAIGQAFGAHADRYDGNAGVFQDRQGRLDRFGAEEADDDVHFCRGEFLRGGGSAFG